MNRGEILDTAKQYVSSDRNSQYGEPEDSFDAIARMWRLHISLRHSIDVPLDSVDVALMMAQMKHVRILANPAKADSWIDAAGYLACGGDIASV
jgi:hypothetical protein